MTTDALIAALEKATGPDRELDGLIYRVAADPRWDSPNVTEADKITYCRNAAPRYTASIDAAMGLVPRNLSVRKEWLAAGSWPARCYISKDQVMPIDDNDLAFHGIGKSEALAICTAALKAIAAQRGGG